jgi:uncharacterized protein YkwD
MRRAIAVLAVAAGACGAQSPEPRQHDLGAISQQVFVFVNAERKLRGVRELVWDERLAAEARRHASRMVTQWFFGHKDPVRGDIGQRLRKEGVIWYKCSENLYQGLGVQDPARNADLGWLKSPGHRRNMLDPEVTHAGTGAAVRADGTVFIAQVYIQPAPEGRGQQILQDSYSRPRQTLYTLSKVEGRSRSTLHLRRDPNSGETDLHFH